MLWPGGNAHDPPLSPFAQSPDHIFGGLRPALDVF